MGVKITELLPLKEINMGDLSGKVLTVDASLWIYQFLSTIRQRDGSLLKDSKGNVTSHLTGLFSRTTRLMQNGLKLAYVFDGIAPELKKKERERRHLLKEEAQLKYNQAKQKEDIDDMKKYAARTSKLTPEMVEEAKSLIKSLGVPVIQAPSEGEAQAAFMVKKGDAYALATQDSDSLMFSTPRLVRNLSIFGKKKSMGKLSFERVNPQMVELSETLNSLGIDQEQLIVLCMLIGTDFNIGGIKGIGPKNAIKLTKQFGTDYDSLFKNVKWDENFDYPWEEVFYTIKKVPVSDDYKLTWNELNIEKVKEILVENHDFSDERISASLEKIQQTAADNKQKSLGDFF